MKFSEIEKERWDELAPYLDTCLLPVTGLTGKESPYEATEQLERLRDMLDLVEIPFKGRVVTYPACHYVADGPEKDDSIARLVEGLRQSGFTYIIVATAKQELDFSRAGADIVLRPGDNGVLPGQEFVGTLVRNTWSGNSAS
ncbi:DUF2487 family protein [Paenibacillus sp. LHD-117]|uniref:DUF2487 family protein n=1 Tax=Paenibacillus sp. LHD-117 TaxID=3071412 RepID=UPI0027DF6D4C|nr:DUF2487 family protein [Paenibacillus sp. LHD-117]MDQ6418211.1 DUF2487 family protein [Paenibacillus sp. LHD-117]